MVHFKPDRIPLMDGPEFDRDEVCEPVQSVALEHRQQIGALLPELVPESNSLQDRLLLSSLLKVQLLDSEFVGTDLTRSSRTIGHLSSATESRAMRSRILTRSLSLAPAGALDISFC